MLRLRSAPVIHLEGSLAAARPSMGLALALVPLSAGLFFACSGGDKAKSDDDDSDDASDTSAEVFFPDVDPPDDTATTAPPDDADATTSTPDTAADTDSDTNVGPCNTFGCACESNADCLDELCIEGQDGYICTKVCSLECPAGFDCLTATGFGPDPLTLCVPRHVPLCRPCLENADCAQVGAVNQGYCLPGDDPDQGRFCSTACSDGVPCPEGFACETLTVEGGAETRQCRPTSGECECRPAWAGEPYETACQVVNDAGACAGRRTCGPDGLTACEGATPAAETCDGRDEDCNGVTDDIAGAPCLVQRDGDACPGLTACDAITHAEICVGDTPAPETCNGEDDNCDGNTDEGSCFDGLTCTNDVCVASQCSNELVLGACLIEGECFEAGQAKPDDPCRVCLPGTSTSSWTIADQTACDDFDPCTTDDTCHTGTCAGEPYVCDDGLACTRDTCDGVGGCSEPLSPEHCLIAGVCYATNDKPAVGSCQVCDPVSNPNAWSNADDAPCDDADPCTLDDVCAGQSCRGAVYSCDDGDPCTYDVCDGAGGCTNPVAEERCTIGGNCYAAGFVKPDEPCFLCDPTKSDTSWSMAAPGAACDDGKVCTSGDVCNGGACSGTTYACDDGLDCTDDTCDGRGGCIIELDDDTCIIEGACVAGGARKTSGSCLGCVPATSDKAWTPLTGQTCNDDQPCTTGDVCQGEICSGAAYLCDDANPCTIDTCDGDGTCTFTLAPSSCVIGGVCFADGVKKADEPCLACRADISTTQWSPVVAGTGCDDRLPCTANDVCNAGSCVGTPYVCNDGLACTSDTCDGDGTCTNVINAGTCLIDGVCRASGDVSVVGGCLGCNPAVAKEAWSPRPGQACNDGVACTSDDTCQEANCVGTAYTCDDGVACTNDSCDGDGTCTFARVDGVCLIAGVCYAAGAQKAGEPCFACRPDLSGTSWSPSVAGTECNDNQACTKDDACANGLCAGTSYTCNDGIACTDDACDGEGGCSATVSAGSCLIAGQCVANGTRQSATNCLWCNPAQDARDWSANNAASCSDGVACTKTDTCVGSSCQGTAYTCDDGLACTTDACVGDGACSATIVGGWCVINGACYAEGALKPGDECLACRPSLATTDWRPVQNGTSCDDETSCTANDKCTGGICFGTPYSCNDGKPCTNDICVGDGTCGSIIDAGSCLISDVCYDDGDTAPGNACLVCDSEQSKQAFVPNSGEPCNDGAACTKLDMCSGSTCVGTAYSCDDGNACTLDACNGSGGCSNVQAANTCIIGGTCYASGVPKPGEPCFACRPEISTSTWSAVAAGASCNDGLACTHSDQCNGGTCSGTAYTCNDGLTCTTDACNGTGGCTATVNSGTCNIGGACYNNGALQTAGGCLVCNASQSQTTWSPNGGASCNDGVACTQSDVCSGSTCGGTAYTCDDGKTCTADSCNGNGTCTFAQTANTCLIAGVCYAANTVKAGDPCLQCRPDLSATTWSPVAGTVSCNDGNACTRTDTCSAGSCVGTSYTCNDGLTCTSDTCNGDGTCSASVNSGSCAIGGACYANGTTDPTNPCRVCNSATNPTGWSNKTAGTSCSDGSLCTHSDQCNASGTCAGTSYSCNDGLACTTDACTGTAVGGVGQCTRSQGSAGSGCYIGGSCVSEGAFNPGNPCQQCVQATTWNGYSANTGNSCNDANACSYSDTCQNGICLGTSYTCNDNLSCTTNTCNGNGTCSYPIVGGTCLISGTCYSSNQVHPTTPCYKCTPTSSQTSWSYNNGASCNDNDSCSTSDSCSSGVCDGSDIVDNSEVNDSQPGRYLNGDINDCAAVNQFTRTATIYPSYSDTDWFYFYDSDVTGCSMYPDVQLLNIPSSTDLDLEVYFRCNNGTTPVFFECDRGTRISGAYGCRSEASGTTSERITIDACCTEGAFGVDCTGDDSGRLDIHVYRFSGTPLCSQPYTVQWGDD